MNERQYDFSVEKNQELKEKRSISFEEIIAAIQSGSLLSVINHPNKEKYPNQQMYIIDIDGYIYAVPFVRKNKNTVFLKTIFKSRKLTKQYLAEKKKGEYHE